MDTKLSWQTLTMLGANLGEENPLPDIKNMPDIHDDVAIDDSIPQNERAYFNYGRVGSILPYRIQDGYDRDKQQRDYQVVVLENDYIKATFMPQYGGRLWSLYDKENKRDLLHVNPVFQPANLALRNAWFSGGVEWNIGMTGHTPYTASPLHTAFLNLQDGTPVLRMYEWERIRRVSYQIDAYLPQDSRFLFMRIRLRNTCEQEVPIYWWSNIAVDETPGTRVIAPADRAFSFDYSRVIHKIPMPIHEGIDKSYTTRVPHALDLFFDIQKSQRKWEAALDEKGEGLVQASTDLLQGRKLFLWGNGSGGKRWQEFLSAPNKAYLEIQAGLANTQMEHLPMPGNAQWEWMEAYGMLKADPTLVHSESWQTAYQCVDTALEQKLPRAVLNQELARLKTELDHQAELQQTASGWAALELSRVGKIDCFDDEQAVFPVSSMGEEQQPWLTLLQTGVFPEWNPNEFPAAYLTQTEWFELLKAAVQNGKSDHWHAWLQLGIMHCAAGDWSAAKEAFEVSFEKTPNAWAKRNLAMLALLENDKEQAANLLMQASELISILPIAIETARYLIQANRYTDFITFFDELSEHFRLHGRMRSMRIHVAILLEDFDYASNELQSGFTIDDMREGEVLLSDLWIMLHTSKIARQESIPNDDALRMRVLKEYPVPHNLDFRMRT